MFSRVALSGFSDRAGIWNKLRRERMAKKRNEYVVERLTSTTILAKTEEEAREKGERIFKDKMGNTETTVTLLGKQDEYE